MRASRVMEHHRDRMRFLDRMEAWRDARECAEEAHREFVADPCELNLRRLHGNVEIAKRCEIVLLGELAA